MLVPLLSYTAFSITTNHKSIDSIFNFHSKNLINSYHINPHDSIVVNDSLYNSIFQEYIHSQNIEDTSSKPTEFRRFFLINIDIKDSLSFDNSDTTNYSSLIITVYSSNDTIIDKYILNNAKLLKNFQSKNNDPNDSVFSKYIEPIIASLSIILISLSLFFIN